MGPDRQLARDDRLVAVLRAQRGLEKARRLAATGSWSHPIEHLRARTALRSAEERRQAAQLEDTDLQAYADQLIAGALMGLRTVGGRFGSTRHQLHPEVDAYFGVLLEAVVDEVTQQAAQLGSLMANPRRWEAFNAYRPNELPELANLLTAGAVRARLTAERDFARAAAADTRLLTSWNGDVLVVQHAVSGLRATFAPTDIPGIGCFGTVYSKHYQIGDLDPGRQGPDPSYFEGLGIGAAVYRGGALELPGVRWRSGMYSDSAAGLRTRLHAEDPYVWAGPCSRCDDYFDDNTDWANRERDDFPPHRPARDARQ